MPGRVDAEASHVARRRTQVALATMLVLLLALAGVAAFAVSRLYSTAENRYLKEAFPLQTGARDVILQMLNEETSVRGYLLTGDTATLAYYAQGRRAVAVDLTGLERLSRRRPELAGDVANVKLLVGQLQAYFQRQIRLVRRGGAGRRRAQRDALAGRTRFDRFRTVAADMLDRSERIVRGAERSERRTLWSTLALVLGIALAAAAIGVGLLMVLPERLRILYRREEDARRAAERGARASRALEHVEDAVVLLDAGGAIRYWNPGAERLLGLAEERAIGSRAAEAVRDWHLLEQALARRHAGVTPLSLADGEHWVAATASSFAEGRVIVLRDVTGERRLERARSEFLATASHELRTPLASVYGAVRTLRRRDRPVEPEVDERLLEVIEQESERLAAIVAQILDSAQLDRGELRLERERCELRGLCERVMASAKARATAAHALVLDAPEPVFVDCDPPRLRQVVANLLDNALKYSPNGGRVEVRVRAGAGRASIEVEDEGVGIAHDVQARVFEKFFRADAQMLSGIGGSGLGLYISRELVERMGGTIRTRSQPGHGSTFTVELPAPAP